ncbi:MAG: hypothetical protein U0360_00585 [Dehalococcoidia bacterium]
MRAGQTVTVGANPVATPTQTLKERTNRGAEEAIRAAGGRLDLGGVTPPWDGN